MAATSSVAVRLVKSESRRAWRTRGLAARRISSPGGHPDQQGDQGEADQGQEQRDAEGDRETPRPEARSMGGRHGGYGETAVKPRAARTRCPAGERTSSMKAAASSGLGVCWRTARG